MDLDIERLNLQLRLAGEPERLQPVASRLRALAGGQLAAALARVQVDAADHSDGEALIFIDRLDVNCAANTRWDDAALVSQIARRLVLALHELLADPALRRFGDRAEYVAAALAAFADGRAASAWWLGEFDGLHALSRSAALRTLIINESDNGAAALARLTASTLARLLDALGDADGARLLAWFERRSGASAPLPVLRAAVAALAPASAARAWLLALAGAERAAPGSAGGDSLRALRSLAALNELARHGIAPSPQRTGGERAALQRLLHAHRLCADWLGATGDAELADLVVQLAARAAAAARRDVDSPPAPAWLDSAHGGLFVLLGRLQRLGWLARWHSLLRAEFAAAQDAPAAAAADVLCAELALRVAALALAGGDAPGVRRDPALRILFGADAQPIEANAEAAAAALRDVLGVAPHRAATLARLLALAASRLLAETARALPGLSASTPAFLRREALALPVRLLAESQGGERVARLGRAALDVLLVLAGVKRMRIEWPTGAPIRCIEDIGA